MSQPLTKKPADSAVPVSQGVAAMEVTPQTLVSKRPKRIGDILIESGLINDLQLNQALSESRATGQPIGAVLVKLGLIKDEDLGECLAKLHHMSYINTKTVTLDEKLVGLLGEVFIKRNMVVPYQVNPESKRLEVIIARPDKIRVLDEVALITGYRLTPLVATHNEMMRLLDTFFNKRNSSDEALAELAAEYSDGGGSLELDNFNMEAEMEAHDAPVVRLVNAILVDAIESNASDIHIEPQKERLLIRFRIDGILKEVKSIPKKMASSFVSRIKVASGMDIAERRRPQDGRMKLMMGSQQVDMRVNSLVVQFGEKVVIRLLKPNATSGGLEKLGLTRDEVERINKMIRSPHGLILVTGPTGSGKTTTLYSALRDINTPDRNISTIEDPIEYHLAGVNQTQVSTKSGLSFALCLRALLRQDPDVIMVGEIRDEETLEAAMHAALTGHLVFSTLHTNSTAKTVARLLEMGAPAYMVSSSVIGILAQRLVRKVCSKCKVAYQASPEEMALLKLPPDAPPVTLYKGTGCDRCNGSGHEGRIGLYEIMLMNRELEELIDSSASAHAIKDAAIASGMVSLTMDGKRKVLSGLTSLEEITRVLGLDLED